MADPNAWQPLIPPGAFGVQSFLTPFWSQVEPFAIARPSPGQPYMDPGPTPRLGGAGELALKQSVVELGIPLQAPRLIRIAVSCSTFRLPWSATIHSALDDGSGYAFNPGYWSTLSPNVVRLGDFGRVMAESGQTVGLYHTARPLERNRQRGR